MTRIHQRAEQPRKRIKLANSTGYTNVEELRAIFRLQNYDELTKGVSSTHNDVVRTV